MINDIRTKQIKENKELNKLFLSANFDGFNKNCNILNGNFYIDSFNYYPITENNQTFKSLFKRQDNNSIDNFYSEEFFENFLIKKKHFKIIKNNFVLGSSSADNYFSNLIHFLPRIFFNNEKKSKVSIHRNLSNKFRNLIISISKIQDQDVAFTYLDDEFYKFENSLIPQFFSIEDSINILKLIMSQILKNVKAPKFSEKIYIRRQNTNYRKIVNESDLLDKLISNGFDIINPQHFEILVQLKIFSKAKLIISPHGSNLTNIIF